MPSHHDSTRPSRRSGVFPRISRASVRKLIVPVFALTLLATVLIVFRAVVLPFIFACILVYLMEPLVHRITRPTKRSTKALPRWVAVILVYICFLSVVTTVILFLVPRVVSEVARLAENTPHAVQEFRHNELPTLNDKLQQFLHKYLPDSAVSIHRFDAALGGAKASVYSAWNEARDKGVGVSLQHFGSVSSNAFAPESAAWSGEIVTDTPASFHKNDIGKAGHWTKQRSEAVPTFRIESDERGGFNIYLSEDALEIVARPNNTWTLRPASDEQIGSPELDIISVNRKMFDLERSFDDIVDSLTNASTLKVGRLMEFTQTLMRRIIDVFLAIVLTLMIAAFLSIDLPRSRRFARSLVPKEYEHSYDELMKRFDIGLGGVVRGQIMICLVNAILVYIGLAVIGVKYSLLLAVFAGFMSIIPIFGSILSSIPIVIVGLTQSFMTGVFVLIWLLSINFAEANFLNPKIIGTAAHIHPVIVIFALLAGQSVFGLVGAILALPITSIILTILGYARELYMAKSEITVQ